MLSGMSLNRRIDDAVGHIMDGFVGLQVHPDVGKGIRALAALGIRLVTLTNGSASIARRLLADAGLEDAFESCLSVEQAGVWKPAGGAYTYAMAACDVEPVDAMLVWVHPWDTDGAHRAGLAAAWINRGGGRYRTTFCHRISRPRRCCTSPTGLGGSTAAQNPAHAARSLGSALTLDDLAERDWLRTQPVLGRSPGV